jgi:hypothetical protein
VVQSDDDVMFEAGAAAERLDLSASGMRRLAVIFEQVHGELPRKPDAKGRVSESSGRLYSGEVLRQLETARAMVEAERYPTIREALQALLRGEPADLPAEVGVGAQVNSAEAWRVVLGELREVRAELVALRSEVATGRALPEGEQVAETTTGESSGVLVRVALWLEQRLHKGRG